MNSLDHYPALIGIDWVDPKWICVCRSPVSMTWNSVTTDALCPQVDGCQHKPGLGNPSARQISFDGSVGCGFLWADYNTC